MTDDTDYSEYAINVLKSERAILWKFLEMLQRQFYETHGAGGNDNDQKPYIAKLASLDRSIALLGKTD